MSEMKEVAALSEQRLQEIRERCEKATPAPWYSVRDDLDVHPNICADDPRGNPIMVAQIRIGLPKDMGSEEANESFILSARQDIPDLLAELTRSRAALLESQQRFAEANRNANMWCDERNDALVQRDKEHDRAEAAEQKLAEQRWIPVSEKLPADFQHIMFLISGGTIAIGSYSRGWVSNPWKGSSGIGEGEYHHTGVTHWRELPAAPPVER